VGSDVIEPPTPLNGLLQRFFIKEIAEDQLNIEAIKVFEIAPAPSQCPDGMSFRKQEPDHSGADEAGSARNKGQHGFDDT
jgi:hypothetical protein